MVVFVQLSGINHAFKCVALERYSCQNIFHLHNSKIAFLGEREFMGFGCGSEIRYAPRKHRTPDNRLRGSSRKWLIFRIFVRTNFPKFCPKMAHPKKDFGGLSENLGTTSQDLIFVRTAIKMQILALRVP
jgi:hypothetical protein